MDLIAQTPTFVWWKAGKQKHHEANDGDCLLDDQLKRLLCRTKENTYGIAGEGQMSLADGCEASED